MKAIQGVFSPDRARGRRVNGDKYLPYTRKAFHEIINRFPSTNALSWSTGDPCKTCRKTLGAFNKLRMSRKAAHNDIPARDKDQVNGARKKCSRWDEACPAKQA